MAAAAEEVFGEALGEMSAADLSALAADAGAVETGLSDVSFGSETSLAESSFSTSSSGVDVDTLIAKQPDLAISDYSEVQFNPKITGQPYIDNPDATSPVASDASNPMSSVQEAQSPLSANAVSPVESPSGTMETEPIASTPKGAGPKLMRLMQKFSRISPVESAEYRPAGSVFDNPAYDDSEFALEGDTTPRSTIERYTTSPDDSELITEHAPQPVGGRGVFGQIRRLFARQTAGAQSSLFEDTELLSDEIPLQRMDIRPMEIEEPAATPGIGRRIARSARTLLDDLGNTRLSRSSLLEKWTGLPKWAQRLIVGVGGAVVGGGSIVGGIMGAMAVGGGQDDDDHHVAEADSTTQDILPDAAVPKSGTKTSKSKSKSKSKSATRKKPYSKQNLPPAAVPDSTSKSRTSSRTTSRPQWLRSSLWDLEQAAYKYGYRT